MTWLNALGCLVLSFFCYDTSATAEKIYKRFQKQEYSVFIFTIGPIERMDPIGPVRAQRTDRGIGRTERVDSDLFNFIIGLNSI